MTTMILAPRSQGGIGSKDCCRYMLLLCAHEWTQIAAAVPAFLGTAAAVAAIDRFVLVHGESSMCMHMPRICRPLSSCVIPCCVWHIDVSLCRHDWSYQRFPTAAPGRCR